MIHFQKKNWMKFWSLQKRKLASFEPNLKTYNLPKYFQKQKQHAEIHCRSWANTNHAIKNEWKQFLGPQNTLLAVKKNLRKIGAWYLMSIFWAGKWHKIGSIFLLNSHEKRPKLQRTIAYSLLYPCWFVTNQNKNTTKSFWRQIC